MRITVDVPDETVMVVVNALYYSGEDLRMTSGALPDPEDGQHVRLVRVGEGRTVQQ